MAIELKKKKIRAFIERRVFSESSTEMLFNQYRCRDPQYDMEDAIRIRRNNLWSYVDSFTCIPTCFVVGEAPGCRGVRFSGVPFTNERQLVNGELPFKGCRSSLVTRWKKPRSSKSSSIFWSAMRNFHTEKRQDFFAWNCIPFYPHEKDLPLKNRTPEDRELETYGNILKDLWKQLESPEKVIAVGKTAKKALDLLEIQATKVAHPAAGPPNVGRFGREIRELL